jgi:hypothetical protein
MDYPNWSIRNENNVGVVRVDGVDYVEVAGTIEAIPDVAYPDHIQNEVIERAANGNIKVLLGVTRNIVNEVGNSTRPMNAKPQYVWLTPYK